MAIFKLINKYFVKSIVGLICLFGLPLFFSMLYFAIGKEQFLASLPITATIGILSVTLMIIPNLIIDLRKSLILKRIGAAKISSHKFLSILFLYFSILVIISIAYSFVLYAILGSISAGAKKAFEKHDFIGTIYSCLVLGAMGILCSIVIGTFVKNSMISSSIAFILIFFAIFTSGLLMPITIVRQVKGLEVFGYIIPLDWPILMMESAWGVTSAVAKEGFDNGTKMLSNELISPIIETINNVNNPFEIVVDNIWNIAQPFNVRVQKYGTFPPIFLDFPIINTIAKSINLIGPYLIFGITSLNIILHFKWGER